MILDEESQELVQMVREFVDNEIIPNVGEIERTGGSAEAILDMACEMGLNTLCLPEEYGGIGLTNVQTFAIAEEIARGDIGIGTTLIANCLASYPVLLSGTPEQKKLWFETMVEKKYAAFCLTEPNAGSDAGGVQTTAVEDGDEWVINGTKSFISNGPIAGIYTVLASTNKKAGAMGLTAVRAWAPSASASASAAWRRPPSMPSSVSSSASVCPPSSLSRICWLTWRSRFRPPVRLICTPLS